jgi:hypothetical protein
MLSLNVWPLRRELPSHIAKTSQPLDVSCPVGAAMPIEIGFGSGGETQKLHTISETVAESFRSDSDPK